MSETTNTNVEQQILGQCILSAEAFMAAMARLSIDDFTSGQHRAIWDAFYALREEDAPVDITTVWEAVRRLPDHIHMSKPTATYIASLPDFVPTTSNIEAYCELLRKVTLRRNVLGMARELIQRVQNPSVDSDALINEMRQGVEQLEMSGKNPIVTMREAVSTLRDRIEAVARQEIAPSFVTGIQEIDQKCWIRQGDIWVLGARSGIGKSHLALQVDRNVARRGGQVLHISSEMLPEDNAMRISAQEEFAKADMFREPKDEQELDLTRAAMREAEKLPIRFVDETDADLALRWAYEIDRKLRQGGGNGLELCTVDYYQDMLLPGDWGRTRDERLGTWARKLNKFARKTQTTLCLVAALKEKVQVDKKTKEMPCPTRGDIRETGVLSYVAPTIILLWERLDDTVDLIFDKSRATKGRRWAKLIKDFDYGRYVSMPQPEDYHDRG